MAVSSVNSNGSDFVVTGSGDSSSSDIYFYFSDAIGTSRIVTTSDGTVCYDADSYPFGGERAYITGCSPNHKFTGKERDSESGLDDSLARYYTSSLGRFMSPDPANAGADATNPQSWKMYAYVMNNPLIFSDPSGLDCVYLDDSGGTGDGASIDNESDEGECNAHGGYWANGYIGSLKNVQTFQNNDNALITSQNGADPEITVASQNESQGVSLLGNVQSSFWSGQFADPSFFTGLDPNSDTAAMMTLELAGTESSRGLVCAGKAAVANTIPFGGHLVGMGSAKGDALDATKAATHPYTTSKALNKLALPNIGEAVVKGVKLPGVAPALKTLEKADPLISAYSFNQDFTECSSKHQ